MRMDNHLAKDLYPELSFLFDGFDELYEKYKQSPVACEFLDEVEEYLKELEDMDLEDGSSLDSKFKVVEKWYEGTLAPNFHYRFENDRLFTDWLEDNILRCCEKEKSKVQTCKEGEGR